MKGRIARAKAQPSASVEEFFAEIEFYNNEIEFYNNSG